MAKKPPTRTENGFASKEGTSEASTSLPPLENTAPDESPNSLETTTATTLTDSEGILKTAALQALQQKIGLVSGALGDWQSAMGRVVIQEFEYTLPSGSKYQAIKALIYLPGVDLVAVNSADGLSFDLVAAAKGKPHEVA
jgi:hypothetical protein